jgi:hypothetical protein
MTAIFPLLCDGRPRFCGLCSEPIRMISDTDKRRLYECTSCEAVEVITKARSWWYHGCVRPDGTARNSNGIRHDGNYGGWLNS